MISKKLILVRQLREKLENGGHSVGSWLQLPDSSVAEIMADAGYDWLAIDMEHGLFGKEKLVEMCRAIELHNTLPFVRLADWSKTSCKWALEAGAAGVFVPMIESAQDLEEAVNNCCWPITGRRGIGFSRSNLFGKYFEAGKELAERPIIAGMIENVNALNQLEGILGVKGLDAIFIGPYDLSGSLGCLGDFENSDFKQAISKILTGCARVNMPVGMHIVDPDEIKLSKAISDGCRFNAFSIDSVFLNKACQAPEYGGAHK